MNDTPTRNLPAETRPPEAATPRRPASASAILALLLALATSILAAWLVYDGNSRSQRLNASISEVRERLDAQDRRIGEVAQGAAQHRDSIIIGIRDLEQRIEETERTLGRRGWDWMLAEGEYFLSLASEQLVLKRNASVAIAALEVADARLRRAEIPEVLVVRDEIAKAVVTLRGLEHPDIPGHALKLSALIGAVPTLPTSRPQQGAANPAPEPATESNNPWVQIWSSITRMIVVRRADQMLPSLLSPEQLTLLRLNLQLRLESARAALMRNDQTNFVAAVREARDGFKTYFDTSAPQVIAAVADLEELERVDISFATPDISAPLQALRNVRSQLELRTARPVRQIGSAAIPAAPAAAPASAPAAKPAPAPAPAKSAPAVRPEPAATPVPASTPAPISTSEPATAPSAPAAPATGDAQ
jgi:uncharacterized protein HemX